MIQKLREALYFIRWKSLHRKSARAIQKWQTRHLAKLVVHAYENVPLYRSLYAAQFTDGVPATVNLTSLPVVTKAHFYGHPPEYCIDASRLFRIIWKTTSGTSGTPFTFALSNAVISRRFLDWSCFRFLAWVDPTQEVFLRARVARVKIRAIEDPLRLFIPVAEYLKNPQESLIKLTNFRPDILESYTSILLKMTDDIEANPDAAVPRPQFVLTFGEMLSPAARERIQSVFHAEVYDRYGIEEVGVVGVECAHHDGMHLNSESVIVEIVDTLGAPVPDGVEGKILITDLMNKNMPFIRYDTGDYGRISREVCRCGLQTPRVWLEGRYAAFITIEGKTIHHLEFDAALDTFMHVIQQYQIAKVSESAIEIRIATGEQYVPDDERRILSAIRSLVGEGVQLTVKIMDEIPVTPRGKCKILVDESKVANG